MFLADKSGTSTLPAIASCGTEWSSCCGRSHHGSCSCRSQLSQMPSLQGFGFRVRFDMPAFKGVSFPSSRVPSPWQASEGELRAALQERRAVELDGTWRRLDPGFLVRPQTPPYLLFVWIDVPLDDRQQRTQMGRRLVMSDDPQNLACMPGMVHVCSQIWR